MTRRNKHVTPAKMAVARVVAKTSAPRGEMGAATKPRAAAKPRQAPRGRPVPISIAAPSVAAQTAAVRTGKGRPASRSDQSRLAELKVKLGDPDYMEGAILRIATVLSASLTLR
jgi:hypothetical protein